MSVNTSDIQLPADGSGKSTATVTKSEDAKTKHLSRVVIEDADGDNANKLVIDALGKIGVINEDIRYLLQAIHRVLGAPGYYDKTANQLRVQVTGTVTSSTSLTSSGDLATINSIQGRLLPLGANRTAWAQCQRRTIT